MNQATEADKTKWRVGGALVGAVMVAFGVDGMFQLLRGTRELYSAGDQFLLTTALSNNLVVHTVLLVTLLLENAVLGAVLLGHFVRKLKTAKQGGLVSQGMSQGTHH